MIEGSLYGWLALRPSQASLLARVRMCDELLLTTITQLEACSEIFVPRKSKCRKSNNNNILNDLVQKSVFFCVIGHLVTASSRELWDIGTSVAMSGLSPRYYLLLWCSCLSEVSSLEIRKPWWKTVRDNLFVESLSGVAGAGPGQAGPVQSVFIVMSWNALLLIISRLQRVILQLIRHLWPCAPCRVVFWGIIWHHGAAQTHTHIHTAHTVI